MQQLAEADLLPGLRSSCATDYPNNPTQGVACPLVYLQTSQANHQSA